MRKTWCCCARDFLLACEAARDGLPPSPPRTEPSRPPAGQNREFANPQILQKIVEYYGIDDIASNYPPHIFDPQAIVARRARDKTTPAPAASGTADDAAPGGPPSGSKDAAVAPSDGGIAAAS
mmetsp:Transcript_22311/g.88571  ORF Transcript_22311/g.88571 Transcript_22311/m.88571 type:complete len:123 (-) Transcript_22311:121-489(-)